MNAIVVPPPDDWQRSVEARSAEGVDADAADWARDLMNQDRARAADRIGIRALTHAGRASGIIDREPSDVLAKDPDLRA